MASSPGIRVEGADDVVRKMQLLGKRSTPAMSWSINKSLTHARSVSNQQIRQQIAAKQADINRELVKRNSKVATLRGTLETPKKGRPLSKYQYSVLKRGGVSVRVKPKGAKIKMPEVFEVAARYMTYSKIPFLARRNAQAIKWLYGPSISQVWTGVRDDDLYEFADFFNRRLIFRIGYEMDRL